jgi:hypothetical protein
VKERQRDESERSGERCPEIEGDREMGTDSPVGPGPDFRRV